MSSSNPVVLGNSFYLLATGDTWTEAQERSVQLGGSLASINSLEEDIFAWKTFGNITPTGSDGNNWGYWIGLHREPNHSKDIWDNWEWVNEDEKTYRNIAFNPGNPSSEPNGSDSPYVHVWGFMEGSHEQPLWNDSPNGGNYGTGGHPSYGLAEIPFIRRGDSAYAIVEGPTWEEAETNANALGGHLVTINDAEENNWINNTFGEYADFTNGLGLMIGYTDQAEEGIWEWISGVPSTYTNWFSGNPDNSRGLEDHAVIVSGSGNGRWNDFQEEWWNLPNTGNQKGDVVGLAEIPLAPNNTPIGTPTLNGDFKVGQTISINESAIQDADNHEYWIPTYRYSWELSSNNGSAWTSLKSDDATDGNNSFTLTSAEVGKQIRGVVSYLDGYGTSEVVASDSLILSGTNDQDQDGDGFIDKVTNYQMWTASGGVPLTNRRGRTYSDETSRMWNLIKAVEVPAGFSILLEGDRKKDGFYRIVSAKVNGVISGASGWMNEWKLYRRGYEEVFEIDFNGNGVVDVA